jgi:RHS repeat-associated protein
VYVDALVLRDRSTQNNGMMDERLWVQQHANWNVTALVNGSGSVVERYVYDPYGKQTVLDANFNTRSSSNYAFVIGFQGARLDTTTELDNQRNRDQSPTLGRWLQTDPLGLKAKDPNLYRYLADNPTNLTDPSGLKWRVSRQNTESKAYATNKDPNDTVADLAKAIGLSPKEIKKWATITDKRNNFLLTIDPNAPLKCTAWLYVPNLMLAYWGGENRRAYRHLMKWNRQVSTLTDFGYKVFEQDTPDWDANQWMDFVRSYTDTRDLQGVLFFGHGSENSLTLDPEIVTNKKHRKEGADNFRVTYDTEWATSQKYHLGVGILFSCHGDMAQVPFSQWPMFHGESGLFVPWPWKDYPGIVHKVIHERDSLLA